MRDISFGALAKAQADTISLENPGPFGPHPSPVKMEYVRAKLAEFKKAKDMVERLRNGSVSSSNKRSAVHIDDDSDDYAERIKKKKRTSKHAPAEMTSKKPVSRKRTVVSVSKAKARDPRFESLSGPINEERIKKSYAFLEGYRDDEMRELEKGIKRTTNADEKAAMQRQLLSMVSHLFSLRYVRDASANQFRVTL